MVGDYCRNEGWGANVRRTVTVELTLVKLRGRHGQSQMEDQTRSKVGACFGRVDGLIGNLRLVWWLKDTTAHEIVFREASYVELCIPEGKYGASCELTRETGRLQQQSSSSQQKGITYYRVSPRRGYQFPPGQA